MDQDTDDGATLNRWLRASSTSASYEACYVLYTQLVVESIRIATRAAHRAALLVIILLEKLLTLSVCGCVCVWEIFLRRSPLSRSLQNSNFREETIERPRLRCKLMNM